MTMNAQKQAASAAATMVQASTDLADFEMSPGMAEMIADMEAKSGDPGDMNHKQRAAYVSDVCRMLKLNPLTRPAQFIRLSGKWVLYLTRTATDQLAARYNLNRKTIVQPHIADIMGTKLAMCVVEVTLPNGRSETAMATLSIADPPNLLMKVESKAKRRATLSILGLGVLCEDEAEDASDASQGPRGGKERPLFATTPSPTIPAQTAPVNTDAEPSDEATPVELALAAIDACKSVRFLSAAAKVLRAKHHPGDDATPRGTHPLSLAEWTVIADAGKAKRAALTPAETQPEPSADDSRDPLDAPDDAAHADYVRDAEAWRLHIEGKENTHAVAGSFHKHSGAFDRAGVRAARRESAVTVIAMKGNGDLASADAFLTAYPDRPKRKASGAQSGEGA